jgi:hypothetical protein
METPAKKRGRKPKSEVQQEDATPKTQQTRGRKPKCVYNTFDHNPSISDDENIIVKLNIQDPAITENKLDEVQPCGYNIGEYDKMSLPGEPDEVKPFIDCAVKSTDLRVVNILKDFEEKNKNNEWPMNTSICCYWCCHKFTNAPFGIPTSYINDTFKVFGCFCSLECAAAYNFKNPENMDQVWERYNLINMLYRRLDLGRLVKPAPDRLVLKMFGGYLEIDEFRDFFRTNKLVSINFPPMCSLTMQVQEINECDVNDYDVNKYIPIDNERINRYKAQVKKKPLKNSLETTMNLKIIPS